MKHRTQFPVFELTSDYAALALGSALGRVPAPRPAPRPARGAPGN